MKNSTIFILGASALGLYFLLRNNGKGTSVMKENGKVDTKIGFDGLRAKNLAPDIYGRQIGRDVYANITGMAVDRPSVTEMSNMGGYDTTSICVACRSSIKANVYKTDIPKIL